MPISMSGKETNGMPQNLLHRLGPSHGTPMVLVSQFQVTDVLLSLEPTMKVPCIYTNSLLAIGMRQDFKLPMD